MSREANTTPDARARSALLAITIAACVALLFYAVTVTATADPFVRPYATSVGIALVVILLIAGIADKGTAKDGIFASLLAAIPRIYRWGVQSVVRTALLATAALIIAALAVWLGPLGVKSVSVACDEAEAVEISGRSTLHACRGALSISMWLSPLQRYRAVSFTCFDGQKNAWEGDSKSQTSGVCGARPIDARYVRNGIQVLEIDSDSVVGRRTLDGVSRLRDALSDGRLPDRRLKDRLLFATWNIRDLGENRRGWGKRLDESYAYIAEIISHFDIVAIQEVRSRAAVDRILAHLGDGYRAEFGFFAPGSAGNREQNGFIYDARKVGLGTLSTTLVVDTASDDLPGTGQPARPPFLAEFIVNGRPLFLVTTHIYYGAMSGERFKRRLAELRTIGKTLHNAATKYFPTHPLILAGDLNVSRPGGQEMEALLDSGFETDPVLAKLASNFGGTRPYDQILVLGSDASRLHFGKTGVFPVFDYVFRDDEWPKYKIDFGRIAGGRIAEIDPTELPIRYQREMRTFQMSDHFPKWAEFRLDNNTK